MKKIICFIVLLTLSANAEMMGQNSRGVFINNDDRSEMQDLLKKDISFAERAKLERKGNKDSIKELSDEEKEDFIKSGKETKTEKSEFQKITEGDDVEDDLAIGESDSKKDKIKLKKYKVKYDRDLFFYANNIPSPEIFKKWMKAKKITEFKFKLMLNNTENNANLMLSAFYYDLYLQRPDLAENFYKLLYKKRGALSLWQKQQLADYLIRTGRGDKINRLFRKMECAAIFRGRGICYYYQGIGEFFRTGNNRNRDIGLSKNEGYKKAKEVFYMSN